MTNHRWEFLFGNLALALIAAGWWLYNGRQRDRIPSRESLDDPEVARAFGRVAMMPQMRLLRWFVARHAVAMTGRGEAVDLGCGPGQFAIELARRSPDLHVTGIDLSDRVGTMPVALAWRSGSRFARETRSRFRSPTLH